MVKKLEKDKVFTRYLGGILHGAATEATPATVIDSFQAEEDIYIIGAVINIMNMVQAENDGESHAVGSLSTAFPLGYTGVILQTHANEKWNTVPAFGYQNPGRNVLVLASENYLEVKEEGMVYCTMNIDATNKTVGISDYYIDALVLFVKKKG